MSPQPAWRPAQGRPGKDESCFLSKVEGRDGFWRALHNLSESAGLPVDALQGFAKELCRCCWSEVDEAMACEGPLFTARTEVEDLKKKLTQCNLSTMKQIAACRGGTHVNDELGEDTIIFHEPLHYLDQDAKQLVMSIVCDKVRQLEAGHAPPSLVEALVRHASGPVQGGGADAAELAEMREDLEEARADLSEARVRAEEAEEVARRTQGQLAVAEARLAEAEQALSELREQEAALRAAHEELQRVSAQQQAEIDRQQAELEKQRVELEEQRAELERLAGEVEREREANAELRAEVGHLQEQLREFTEKVAQLQTELAELQSRFEALEKEAHELREELARRNNTRTRGTQTTLTGPKLDEQAAEVKRLKVMLEELQMKLKEFMDKCKRKIGTEEMKKIAGDLGLDSVLKEDTVFQRLYDDAMDRVQRLEKLRDKIRMERQGLPPLRGSPRSAAAEEGLASPEVSVLAAVEHSQLTGLRHLVPESEQPAVRERPARPSPTRWEAPSPLRPSPVPAWAMATAGFSPPQPQLKPSSSLPALHTATQSVSLFTLDMGARKRRSNRPGR